jgi:hypothetical protein
MIFAEIRERMDPINAEMKTGPKKMRFAAFSALVSLYSDFCFV